MEDREKAHVTIGAGRWIFPLIPYACFCPERVRAVSVIFNRANALNAGD
jgi:hypothetical protein